MRRGNGQHHQILTYSNWEGKCCSQHHAFSFFSVFLGFNAGVREQYLGNVALWRASLGCACVHLEFRGGIGQ